MGGDLAPQKCVDGVDGVSQNERVDLRGKSSERRQYERSKNQPFERTDEWR
jgi:hypothetical protein